VFGRAPVRGLPAVGGAAAVAGTALPLLSSRV